MTDAYGNIQTDSPHAQAVIHPHQEDTQIQNLTGAAVCKFVSVSIMNVTFLPGFRREALKRALNRKQGTSEISQANRAWWIIQQAYNMLPCCLVCRELTHMQGFSGVCSCDSCADVYLHIGLLGCVLWVVLCFSRWMASVAVPNPCWELKIDSQNHHGSLLKH